jgi:molybdenum cofactor cytidylyltransferase
LHSQFDQQVVALLLAAGRSRRMGAFKPLLPFGDDTVIGSAIANLRAAHIKDIIVVLGHRADQLQQALRQTSVTFVINPDPDSEMSASIACGLKRVSATARALLISLADHPAVPPTVINSLIERWRQGARLVQPEYKGRGGHPVLIDLSYRQELLALDPDQGLRALFAAHRDEVVRLTVDSPYVARDLDTWEDYVRLHTDVFGKAPN